MHSKFQHVQIGDQEKRDLVELWMTHYINRTFSIDTADVSRGSSTEARFSSADAERVSSSRAVENVFRIVEDVCERQRMFCVSIFQS